MRIAQVSPLYESVPPKLYGGTERVVSYLTEELVRQGHDVTLFASGDSVTKARLEAVTAKALRLDTACIDPFAHHILLLERVFKNAKDFDIIHFHCDYLHFPLSRRHATPTVTTLHGRLDLPDLVALYREFPEMPLVSISDAQRKPLAWANWVGTVYHGLPRDLYHEGAGEGGYLCFVGRISPEKGVAEAIEIAKQSGIELHIAAKVDRADEAYFKREIEPLLDHPLVKFIGEITEAEKDEFLGKAKGMLLPIDWPEPFGLAMIEAMACGTPVIAFRRGSVPEVIDEGRSGFIVNKVDEAVDAVGRLDDFDRHECRANFERRFTAARMAQDYVKIYKKIVEGRRAKPLATGETALWQKRSA